MLGITTFEALLNLMAANGARERVARIRRTLDWVRASCEAEGLPDWCVAMVIKNFERILLTDQTCPLLPEV